MKLLSALAVGLLLAGPVSAQDYDKGLAASQVGNYALALQEWLPLAEQGNSEAQFSIGFYYQQGVGVLQNDAEAMKWYLLAAKQGHANAQMFIGMLYYRGIAVLQDYVTSHMWLNLSSVNGSSDGSIARDSIAGRMSSDQIAEAQHRARVCMASNYKDCD